jgi:hypothetical protein
MKFLKNGQEHTKMLVRMPRDIRQWIEHEAELNASPMTSEIVRALRSAMAARQREQRA